jgi:hypothetical protein
VQEDFFQLQECPDHNGERELDHDRTQCSSEHDQCCRWLEQLSQRATLKQGADSNAAQRDGYA